MTKKTQSTKKAKILTLVRDVTFMLVVVYAAVMTFLVVDAEAKATTAEIELLSHSTAQTTVLLQPMLAMQ